MTTDTQLAPTDAEIDALWRFEASKNWDSTLAMRTSYTRAVLAKWGTPAPVGVEPVAWAFKYDDGTWHDPSTTEHSSGMRPLFAAPKLVEREPLTDAQIKGLVEDGVFFGNCKEIVRAIEAAHGISIKGGQHVE